MRYVLAMLLAAIALTAWMNTLPVQAQQATPGKNPLNITSTAPLSSTTFSMPLSLTPFDITVDGVGRLNPKPDITAQEAVWLNVLLTIGFAELNPYRQYLPDYAGFIKLHHLERHFDKVKP